jgi:CHAD domain-containing protein
VPRPTPVPGLGPRTPAAIAARKILAARLGDVRRYEAPLARKRSADTVHDMRVATRRLRAALHVFSSLGDVHAAGDEVKRLQDALGQVRDRDVQLEWLGKQRGAAPLSGALRSELPEHEERLAKAVRRFEGRGLPLIDAASAGLAGDRPLTGKPVRRVLLRRLRQLERRLDALWDSPDAVRAHELRKTVKKLRYEVEIVRPAMPRTVDAITELLRPFQELLGELHDHDVRLDLVARSGLADLRERVAAERMEWMARTAREVLRWHAEDVAGALRKLIERATSA